MDKLVCFKVVGRLNGYDFQNLAKKIEPVIAKHGAVYLYVDLEKFGGWEWQVSWHQSSVDSKYWNKVEKIAFVGKERREDLGNYVANLVMDGRAQYFTFKHRLQALEWIKKQQF